MPKIQIMPSLLAAPFGRLEEACLKSQEAGSDGIHLDIMDGHFVNNLSFGPEVVKVARDATSLHRHVHLMVTRPDLYAGPFIAAGAQTVLFHIEAECDPFPLIHQIRKLGARAGITLNPETPAEAIREVIPLVDEVLVMSVHPGFGGQAFIPEVLPKIQTIRFWAPQMEISIDGGIDQDTAVLAAGAGANIMLAGSSLFKLKDMKEGVRSMRQATHSAYQKGNRP